MKLVYLLMIQKVKYKIVLALLIFHLVILCFKSNASAAIVDNMPNVAANKNQEVTISIAAGVGMPEVIFSKKFTSMAGNGPSLNMYREIGFILAKKYSEHYGLDFGLYYNGFESTWPRVRFEIIESTIRWKYYCNNNIFTFWFLGFKLGYLLWGKLSKIIDGKDKHEDTNFSLGTNNILSNVVLGFILGINKTFDFGLGIQYGVRFRAANIGIKGEKCNFLYEIDMMNIMLSYDFMRV